MWTRSARKPEGFKVTVKNFDGEVTHEAWYATAEAAQEAGQRYERMNLLPAPTMTLDELMSDDELLAELLG